MTPFYCDYVFQGSISKYSHTEALEVKTSTYEFWGKQSGLKQWLCGKVGLTDAVDFGRDLERQMRASKHIVPPRKSTSAARNNLGAQLTIKMTIY